MARPKKARTKKPAERKRYNTNRSPEAYAKVDELVDLKMEREHYERALEDVRERMRLWAEEARAMRVAPSVLIEKMGIHPDTAQSYLKPKPKKER